MDKLKVLRENNPTFTDSTIISTIIEAVPEDTLFKLMITKKGE